MAIAYPYTQKQVVVYASDLLLYINGVDDLLVCQGDTSRARFTDSITSATVDLKVDGAPGSATFSLHVPRHSAKRYFRYGRCVIKPMMEVTMFLKGRFLDQNKRPVYYQSFWGVVTDVSVDYSSNQHTINITCQDILYFWAITRIATNPSVFQQTSFDNTLQLSMHQSIFSHLSPYQVILALARVMHGSLIAPQNFRNFGKGQSQLARATFESQNKSAMEYWRSRQFAIGQRLRIWGASMGEGDESIKNMAAPLDASMMDTLTQTAAIQNKAVGSAAKAQGLSFPLKRDTSKYIAATMKDGQVSVRNAFSLDNSLFDQYMPYNQKSQVADFSTGEDMTRMEIAEQVKEFIGYEFFMDVTGELIFKPPFYNVDVRENDPVSIIRDLDIISFSKTERIQDLLTKLDVTGSWNNASSEGDVNSLPHGSHIDYHLAREFGIKSTSITRGYLHDPTMCVVYAISELSRMNANRHTASLTIIGRPELRLGYPVYIESDDSFYYVDGITHTYSPNGKLETSLSLSAKRSKYLPYDQKKYKEGRSLDYSDVLRPRIKGVANVVLTMAVPAKYKSDIKPIGPDRKSYSVEEELDAGALSAGVVAQWGENEKKNQAAQQNKKVKSGQKPVETKPPTQWDALSKGMSKLSTSTAGKKLQELNTIQAKKTGDSLSKVKQKVEVAVTKFAVPIEPKKGEAQVRSELGEQFTETLHTDARQPIEKLDALHRYAEGALGIDFQTYGLPVEIVQKGVYMANRKQIPVSDEFGYELIGGFGYGRGVKLDPTGVLKTFLPSSELVAGQEEVEKKKKGEPYDASKIIMRITGEPELAVLPPGHSYDDKKQDHVSRYTGKTIGTYRHQEVGRYLTDMGHTLAEAYNDPMECEMSEMEASVLDGKLRSIDNNKNLYSNDFYGKLSEKNSTAAALGEAVFQKGGSAGPNKDAAASLGSSGGASGSLGRYASNVTYNKERVAKMASARKNVIGEGQSQHDCYKYAGLAIDEAFKGDPKLFAKLQASVYSGYQDRASQFGDWAKTTAIGREHYAQYKVDSIDQIIPGTVLVYKAGWFPGNTAGHIEVKGDDGKYRSDGINNVIGGKPVMNKLLKAGVIELFIYKGP